MRKTAPKNRNVVALVSADRTPPGLRGALEEAGFHVPVAYARDFRGDTTAFSTFVETYKPDVIVLDLHPPASDALKDVLSFRAVRSAERADFVFVCSDGATHDELPEHLTALRISESVAPVLDAVREAVAARQAA